MASAMPSKEKTGKSFSLFSVVSFPNEECQTIMDPAMTGLCVTAEECSSRTGGTASGNCASGFGVCCFTVTSATTATISETATYIQNTGFPTAVGATGTVTAASRAYTINGGASIEQIRLDFQTGVFEQPVTTTGLCGGDAITLAQGTNTNIGFATLCGTLTGQHIYLDHGTTTSSGITIATSTTTFARTWKILVRLLPADSPLIAPSGCRQFFTGETGTITSFNHVNGAAVGTILGSTNYKACIRMEAGNNCVTYREARSTGTPDAFNLAVATAGAGAKVGAAACTTDVITIPGALGVAGAQPRFCGANLSTVSGETTGSVVSSNAKMPGIRVTTTAANRATTNSATSSFEIKYAQKK